MVPEFLLTINNPEDEYLCRVFFQSDIFQLGVLFATWWETKYPLFPRKGLLKESAFSERKMSDERGLNGELNGFVNLFGSQGLYDFLDRYNARVDLPWIGGLNTDQRLLRRTYHLPPSSIRDYLSASTVPEDSDARKNMTYADLDGLSALIDRMLQIDPLERISAAEALEHPWLAGVNV